jgi:hypothetical protein
LLRTNAKLRKRLFFVRHLDSRQPARHLKANPPEPARLLNLAAAAIYVLVAALALGARRGLLQPAARMHWAGVALCFAALAAWRLLEGEAALQELARQAAHSAGDYDRRREWQGPVVAAALLFGVPALGWAAWRVRGVPPVLWSRIATLGLLAYSAVRAISFHPVDALIYAGIGRLHLNHVIDIGLCAVVAACALYRPRSARHAGAGRAPGRRPGR